MRVRILGDLPAGPIDLEAMLEARDHEVRRVRLDELAQECTHEPPEVIVGDPSDEDFAEAAAWARDVADPPLLVLAAIRPQAWDACADAVAMGADECVPLHAEGAYVEARLALLERRHRKRFPDAPEPPPDAHRPCHAAVADLGRRVLDGHSLQALAEHTVSEVQRTLNVATCEVLLRADVGNGVAHAYLGVAASDSCRLDTDEDTQAGFARVMAQTVVVESLADETRFEPAPHLVEAGVVSAVTVPIRGPETHYGLVEVGAAEPTTFAEHDLHFLQCLANTLAYAAERVSTARAYRESEARAHAILETTVDGVITIDERGIIQSFNTAAERIFGYREGEVIGKNVKVLMPTPYREEHDGYIQSYHDTGRRRIIGIGREVVGKRKDGTTFPMDLAVSEVEHGERVAFMGVVRDISDRRKLEQEILRISEQERRRIGQDLHDGLGQMLTGIGLITNNLARRLEARDDPAATDVAEITELIREADQHARGLARGLVPVDLEASGLASALQRLVVNAERLFGIRCTFTEVGSVLLHDNTIATHLYRIAQEAVSNAVKHGRAKTVKVSLAGGSNQLRLRIQDDGVGFPEELDEETRGMGVRIMHYRARIIGANLEISGALDGGTTLTCTLRNLDRPVPVGGEEYGKVG